MVVGGASLSVGGAGFCFGMYENLEQSMSLGVGGCIATARVCGCIATAGTLALSFISSYFPL